MFLTTLSGFGSVSRHEDLGGLQVLELIGSGGFSQVYRGLLNGLDVAVKVIPCQRDEDGLQPLVVQQAVEVAVLSMVSHPNILQVSVVCFARIRGVRVENFPRGFLLKNAFLHFHCFCPFSPIFDQVCPEISGLRGFSGSRRDCIFCREEIWSVSHLKKKNCCR